MRPREVIGPGLRVGSRQLSRPSGWVLGSCLALPCPSVGLVCREHHDRVLHVGADAGLSGGLLHLQPHQGRPQQLLPHRHQQFWLPWSLSWRPPPPRATQFLPLPPLACSACGTPALLLCPGGRLAGPGRPAWPGGVHSPGPSQLCIWLPSVPLCLLCGLSHVTGPHPGVCLVCVPRATPITHPGQAASVGAAGPSSSSPGTPLAVRGPWREEGRSPAVCSRLLPARAPGFRQPTGVYTVAPLFSPVPSP